MVFGRKCLFCERSTQVPLIIYAPNTASHGAKTAALTELVDIYPTLADLCGLKPPSGLDGESLRPILDNPSLAGKGFAVTQVTRFHGKEGQINRDSLEQIAGVTRSGTGESLDSSSTTT